MVKCSPVFASRTLTVWQRFGFWEFELFRDILAESSRLLQQEMMLTGKKDSIWWVNHKSKTTGLKEKLKCSTELRQVVNFCVSNNCHVSYAKNIKLYQYINDERANDKMLSHFSGCFGKTCSFSVFALEELLHETLKDPQMEHLLKKPLCVCFQKEIQTALGSKWSWGLMTTYIYNVEAESCWHHRISTHAHRFPLISPQSVPLALFGTKDIWSISLYKFHLWPVAAWRVCGLIMWYLHQLCKTSRTDCRHSSNHFDFPQKSDSLSNEHLVTQSLKAKISPGNQGPLGSTIDVYCGTPCCLPELAPVHPVKVTRGMKQSEAKMWRIREAHNKNCLKEYLNI